MTEVYESLRCLKFVPKTNSTKEYYLLKFLFMEGKVWITEMWPISIRKFECLDNSMESANEFLLC